MPKPCVSEKESEVRLAAQNRMGLEGGQAEAGDKSSKMRLRYSTHHGPRVTFGKEADLISFT